MKAIMSIWDEKTGFCHDTHVDTNRAARRAKASVSRSLQATRPKRLTRIHESDERWNKGAGRPSSQRPLEVWESQEFLVQIYALQNNECHDPRLSRRMTVCRVTMRPDGRWDDNITWDDLQRVKREVGYGDAYAIEVYPRDADVVNVANMRHLWLFAEPLDCGWFGGTP